MHKTFFFSSLPGPSLVVMIRVDVWLFLDQCGLYGKRGEAGIKGGVCYSEVKPNDTAFNNEPNKGGECEICPVVAAQHISHESKPADKKVLHAWKQLALPDSLGGTHSSLHCCNAPLMSSLALLCKDCTLLPSYCMAQTQTRGYSLSTQWTSHLSDFH